MAIRIQKKWSALGAPATAGDHNAPAVGTIVGISDAHLQSVRESGDSEAIAVLEALESSGFDSRWQIVEIKGA